MCAILIRHECAACAYMSVLANASACKCLSASGFSRSASVFSRSASVFLRSASVFSRSASVFACECHNSSLKVWAESTSWFPSYKEVHALVENF